MANSVFLLPKGLLLVFSQTSGRHSGWQRGTGSGPCGDFSLGWGLGEHELNQTCTEFSPDFRGIEHLPFTSVPESQPREPLNFLLLVGSGQADGRVWGWLPQAASPSLHGAPQLWCAEALSSLWISALLQATTLPSLARYYHVNKQYVSYVWLFPPITAMSLPPD